MLEKFMKLTLIGYGFVGKAVHNVLQDYYNIKIVDPKYNDNVINDDSDGYIVCVPTPTSHVGSCDMSIVNTVVNCCPDDKPILIKSTISLEGWEVIKNMNKQICFSPEFLTAANANEDFKNQKFMLFGGDNIDFWEEVFILAKGFTPIYGTVKELILTKYLRNSFLATKVAFFNEVYDFCQITNIDYNNVAEMVGMDDRITRSHMQIPGPDGERGFGGACFPKDTMALLLTGLYYKTPFSILRQVVESNKRIKND
jgi:UDPglucose 6-dehydrogenase